MSTESKGLLFTGYHYFEDDEEFCDKFDKGEPWQDMDVEEVITKYGRKYRDGYALDEHDIYTDGSFWPCVVFQEEINETNNAFGDEIDSQGSSYTVRIIQFLNSARLCGTKRSCHASFLYIQEGLFTTFICHTLVMSTFKMPLSDDIFQDIWKDRL